uniref:hypothetical protein n=1 Tax=Paenarthrobacter ureafaciens TaxID=37931 RepID=UPI003F493DD4
MGLRGGKDGEADRTETVLSLTEKVIAGEIDATTAGQRMRTLVTRLVPATTDEERRERYHEAAIETDDNSFTHVEGLKLAGALSREDYTAIRKAMTGDDTVSETNPKLEHLPQPESTWEWHAELDGTYKYIGDPKQGFDCVGVKRGRVGGITVIAYSWNTDIGVVDLTGEQAKELVRIIGASHREGGGYECVGTGPYDEVGITDWRDGIRVLVSELDQHATVDLTAEQAQELISVIQALLPDTA